MIDDVFRDARGKTGTGIHRHGGRWYEGEPSRWGDRGEDKGFCLYRRAEEEKSKKSKGEMTAN